MMINWKNVRPVVSVAVLASSVACLVAMAATPEGEIQRTVTLGIASIWNLLSAYYLDSLD